MPEMNIDLGQCFCGDDATWYRTAAAPAFAVDEDGNRKGKRGKSLGTITLDDIETNLCDACFRTYTGTFDEPLPGWKRQDSIRRQLFAGEESQEAQEGDGIEFEGRWIPFDDGGDGRLPPGDWAGD